MNILPPKPGGKFALSQSIAKSLPGLSDAFAQYTERKRMDAAKKKQEAALEREGYGSLIGLPEHIQKSLLEIKTEDKKSQIEADNIEKALLKANLAPETAELYKNFYMHLTKGGKSTVTDTVNDLIRRSDVGRGKRKIEEPKPAISKIDVPGLEEEDLTLDFPELPEPVGLKPADIVKQQSEREKINTPLYESTVDNLNALEDDYRDLELLRDLNQTETLPKGWRKWNVNWDSGDLRFPALASPESQLYVKTIARMLGKAKEYFPGRVTNFDLETFKKRFPTLANSAEGRSLIAKQLELSNRIAYLDKETLRAALEHYGSGGDPMLIRKYANQNFRKKKKVLEERLKTLDGQLDHIYKTQKPSKDEEEAPEVNEDQLLTEELKRRGLI